MVSDEVRKPHEVVVRVNKVILSTVHIVRDIANVGAKLPEP